MKFGHMHLCCIFIAIVILFYLLNRVSMYTGSSPMSCTCTSSQAGAATTAPAAVPEETMAPAATMAPPVGELPGMPMGN
jgi:hypothetical protein